MDSKIKDKWIKALVSGEYKQGKSSLVTKRGGYCCLGVLGKVLGKDDGELSRESFLRSSTTGRCLVLGEPVQLGLAYLNDEGVPFEVIAGFIKENVK